MRHRTLLVILMAMMAGGCTSLRCGGGASNQSQSGGCSAGATFLR